MGLAKEILQGDVRATAKLMRDVEDGLPGITEELKILYPHTGGGSYYWHYRLPRFREKHPGRCAGRYFQE